MPQCEKRKQDGKRCKANALHGTKLCISHNPKAEGIKRAAVAKGGRNRRTPERAAKPTAKIELNSVEDLLPMLFGTIRDIRNGELDANLGRSLGYLASVAAKVAETVQLETRLTELEKRCIASMQEGS